MRLTLKLTIALVVAILPVIAVSAGVRVDREIHASEADLYDDDVMIGRTVAGATTGVWRSAGETEARLLVDGRMGASVRVASSGWELLAFLADHHDVVDLVISDVRMPIPGGVDALAMARTAGVTAPFVLITAFADDRVRDAARGLHASVLDKPFLASELEATIRELLVNIDAGSSSL